MFGRIRDDSLAQSVSSMQLGNMQAVMSLDYVTRKYVV